MKIPSRILNAACERLFAVSASRRPDLVIGNPDAPYMRRWWIFPRNRFLNVYLHLFLRSDTAVALHDHPWINCSVLLQGEYTEHVIAEGGVHVKTIRTAGEIKMRGAKSAHRIELHAGPCWTLFITGPKIREWGFHCPRGWRHWKEFTNPKNPGEVGRGCD